MTTLGALIASMTIGAIGIFISPRHLIIGAVFVGVSLIGLITNYGFTV